MRFPRLRKPRPMDVIRVDGKLHAVVSVTGWGDHVTNVELRPLGEVLARHLAVSDRDEPMPLEHALIEAGWSPPGESSTDIVLHTIFNEKRDEIAQLIRDELLKSARRSAMRSRGLE